MSNKVTVHVFSKPEYIQQFVIFYCDDAEIVEKLRAFGAISYFNLSKLYTLYANTSAQKVLQAIDKINNQIEKPQIKRRFAIHSIIPGEQFCFHASMEDSELLNEFGRVEKFNYSPSDYLFKLNKQYDLQDVIDYVNALNTES